MRLISLLLMLAAVGAVAARADPLQNAGQFGVGMRAGPGDQFPMIHVLDPGEVAERGRCDLDRRWCLLTAGDKVGWVDTLRVAPPRSDLALSDPIRPLRTAPVESSSLDDPARPLPDAIVDAVRGATGGRAGAPPGAHAPLLLSTTEAIRNVTDGLVNLRAGPGTDAPVIDRLRPGEGGVLDVCDPSELWCRIDVPGMGRGWVKMTLMGLRRL